MAVPHRAAAGRIRLRHVAEGRLQVRRRRRTTGARCRSTRSAASSTSRRDRRTTISTARIGSGRICSPTACSRSTRKTGKRLWHFQTVHHDLWDFDNVSAPQLVTVRHNGQKVDAVAHAGKTGFLYVLDRVTGKPLWPIEERPVPKSEVPGEQAWPTQPFPTKPPAFVRQTFTVDDVNPWLATPEQYEAMRERVEERRATKACSRLRASPTRSRCPAIRADRTGARPPPIRRRAWCSSSASIRSRFSSSRTSRSGRLEAGRGGGGNNASLQAGYQGYQTYCRSCHGADLKGALPGVSSLVGVTDRDGRRRDQGGRHRRQRTDACGRRHHRGGDRSRSSRISPTERRRPDADALAVEGGGR